MSAELATSVLRTSDRLAPSIVKVASSAHFGNTGVLWSAEGHVVTTARGLPSESDLCVVVGDGHEAKAELVGRDLATDIAVLLVEGIDAAPVTWRQADARVGTFALSLARPGRSLRAAFGMVGVFGEGFRAATGATIDRWIQVDRDLPRGFAGSLLVDLEGRAIGIHSRGLVRGATIAVPHSTIERVVKRLIEHGEIPRGYIGVAAHPARFPQAYANVLGQREAVVVVAIEEGGPAEQAGVQVGDVILEVAGERLSSPLELRALLQERVGDAVTARLLRGGNELEVEITTGRRH